MGPWNIRIEVFENGGLDLDSWDGAIAWFGVLMGFFFLLRSSEYLRRELNLTSPDVLGGGT